MMLTDWNFCLPRAWISATCETCQCHEWRDKMYFCVFSHKKISILRIDRVSNRRYKSTQLQWPCAGLVRSLHPANERRLSLARCKPKISPVVSGPLEFTHKYRWYAALRYNWHGSRGHLKGYWLVISDCLLASRRILSTTQIVIVVKIGYPQVRLVKYRLTSLTWRRHDMETLSVLLAPCEGNAPRLSTLLSLCEGNHWRLTKCQKCGT